MNTKMIMTGIVSLLLAVMMAACDEDSSAIRPTAVDSWTDPADGTTYECVRIGEQEWMTSNYKGGSPYWETFYYDAYWGEGNPLVYLGDEIYFRWSEDEDVLQDDFDTYGNLYSYEDACALEPGDGWRLPTDSDWQRLECSLGMAKGVAAAQDWRGDDEGRLIRLGSDRGIALPLAGLAADTYNRNHGIRSVGEAGYYWTADSETDNLHHVWVVYRRISSGSGQIYRNTTEPNKLMRVRLVRDIVK